MTRLIFALSLSLLVCQPNSGQSFDEAKMDELFDRIDQANRGMGSVSVFAKGEEVYQRTIGYLDIDRKTEANNATQYRVGSITKMFTSVIILQLVEEGVLTLDTTLDSYFPDVKNAEVITIEQLLRHRSGVFSMTSAKDYHKWETSEISKEKLLKKITKYEAAFPPDTKADYSNSGFVLLTLISEKATGKDYQELVKAIANTCGLQRTGVGGKIAGNQAFSYEMTDEWELSTETHMSVPLGAGAVISTPTDINQFLRYLFEGKLISDQSLIEMRKLVDGFGLGVFQVPFYDKKAFGHTGGIDGFRSTAFYFPRRGSIGYLPWQCDRDACE
ncbi:MAG: serine hydrolase domain-containing protein [Bacteroidota bacterium]